MYHPMSRVLTILELLQTYPSLSGAELARRLDVDRRTVRRYVAILRDDLGIPVETERGPHGGYRLGAGFKLPPLLFNNEEALAITLALSLARSFGVSVAPHVVEGALAKVERVLPPEVSGTLQAVAAAVAVRAPEAPRQPEAATIVALSAAIQARRRVRLGYTSRLYDQSERDFDPYGLVYHQGRWYAAGWCHLRAARRLLRLDRISRIERLDEAFDPPAGFDSAEYVFAELAAAPSRWSAEVLVEAPLEHVLDRLPPHSLLVEQTAAGIVLRAEIDRLDWLARALANLECPFVVRRPPELRAALLELAGHLRAQAER
ncbi:MAG TPA: YafY family protein [Herpetosiphonaceae bacterium]|nr:YafY family protein [Herpetosiphonaceae bacterium]